VIHRAGRSHGNADGLSRFPHGDACNAVADTWLPVMDPAEIKAAQTADPCIGQLAKWVQKLEKPPYQEIQGAEPTLKYYWARFEQLLERNGLIYLRTYDETGEPTTRLLIPEQLRGEILTEAHNAKVAGHLGEEKTLGRLRTRFHWKGMKKDVQNWIRHCPQCERVKSHKKAHAKLQSIESGYPMELCSMDILGPLPTTDRGKRFVLVVMDYFTRWAEAYALPDHQAPTIARTLVSEFFSRFGICQALLSDQGTDFQSKLLKEVCEMLDIKRLRTTSYHPQCDGLVERMNRTLIMLIRLNVEHARENWDRQLGLVLMAYRSVCSLPLDSVLRG